MINVIQTEIPGVVIIEPKVFGDERGYFFESWSNSSLLIVEGEMNLYLALNNLCIYAVNAFVIISGLFGIKSSWKKAVSLLTMVLFYTFFFTTLPHIINGEYRTAIKSLLIILHTPYWFITDYLLLMLFAPILNNAFENIDSKTMKLFTIGLVLVAIYLGFVWGHEIDRSGYNFFHFIVLYAIGRSIAEGWLRVSKTLAGTVFIIAIVANTLLVCYLFHIGKNDEVWRTTYYSNPLLMVSATSLVLLVKDIYFHNKMINWVAASSLGIYLFQNTDTAIDKSYNDVSCSYMTTLGGVNP